MDRIKASELINALHFMPGWKFEARPDYNWAGPETGVVAVRALIDTVNSDREDALKGYPEKITIAPEMRFDASATRDGYELYAHILIWAQEVWMHEAREFLRVGDDMQAPFHPHRLEGRENWASVTGEYR